MDDWSLPGQTTSQINQDSPYISERKGYKIGDSTVTRDGKTIVYQGNDKWIDVDTNVSYTAADSENGLMLTPDEEEKKEVQTAQSNEDSPYVSERYGFRVGDTVETDSGFTVTYQGNDKWIDVDTNRMYTAKDNGSGVWVELDDDTVPKRIYGQPGETPVSEQCGYSVGDEYLYRSLDGIHTRTYIGNDIWTEPDGEQIKSFRAFKYSDSDELHWEVMK